MPVDTSMIDAYGFYSKYVNTVGKPSNSRGDGKEYHGSCPWCFGTDRFVFWDSGRYSCGIRSSGCGKQGRDSIDFLRDFEGLDFFSACESLGVDPGSEYTRTEKQYASSGILAPPCKQWQERAQTLIHKAQTWLWSPCGSKALAYLRGRGFTDETIRAAQLGYIPVSSDTGRWFLDTFEAWGLKSEDYPEDKKGVWLPEGILIPWRQQGDIIWKLNIRRFSVLKENDPRYMEVTGSQGGLYNGDVIRSDVPIVLLEGELDALSGIQSCDPESVTFVATGSTGRGRDPLWIAHINKAPYTLIAFDDDEEKNGKRAGDEGVGFWFSVLSRCHQVLPWAHDLNKMLQQGMDLRAWVLSGIEEYEAIQQSKQIASSFIEEPAYFPAESETDNAVSADQPSLAHKNARLLPYWRADRREWKWMCGKCHPSLLETNGKYRFESEIAEANLKAQSFYSSFVSRPECAIRIREDGSFGIAVPDAMPDEEYQRIEATVLKFSTEIRAILQQASQDEQFLSRLQLADSARSFYDVFCGRYGHYLRLKEDKCTLAIGVPSAMSDEVYEQIECIAEQYSDALRAMLQEIDVAA